MHEVVSSNFHTRLVGATRIPSFAGQGLPERMRSTVFAFMGLTAAAGLALVAIFAQVGFPLLEPAPLPSDPSQTNAIAGAEAVGFDPRPQVSRPAEQSGGDSLAARSNAAGGDTSAGVGSGTGSDPVAPTGSPPPGGSAGGGSPTGAGGAPAPPPAPSTPATPAPEPAPAPAPVPAPEPATPSPSPQPEVPASSPPLPPAAAVGGPPPHSSAGGNGNGKALGLSK